MAHRYVGIAGWGWAVLTAMCLGWPARAFARDYLVNQPYTTAEQGEFAVALWSDMNFVEADNDETYTFKQQVEFEYGLTDHLQLAYYEVYTWDRRKDWERDQFKLEAKYRLAEARQWPVDITLYTEYKNPDGPRDRRSDAIENKLILSKNLGAWNVVANLVAEKDINTHSDWEFEYTAGVSYALSPRTRLGLEVKETLGDADVLGVHREDHKAYLIPGLYTDLTSHVRWLIGPSFGLTRASDDLQLKSIVEVEF